MQKQAKLMQIIETTRKILLIENLKDYSYVIINSKRFCKLNIDIGK